MMYKKFLELYKKTIYVSKLTTVGNKKLRILLSVLLSNFAVFLDIVMIVSFSKLLTDRISYNNVFILEALTILTSSWILLPLLVLLRFTFLFIEKLNIESLS